MKVKITPSQLTSHYIQVPPSKSYAHRAIICASVAKGISRIDNIDYSKDISATLSAMETFGAKITYGSNYVLIEGVDSFRKESELHVHCKESGSTLRFLIPLFSLCQNKVTFTGEGRLMQRPQSIYEEVFLSNGTPLVRTEHELIVSESIKPGTYCIQGNVSSQFISGLLFALPLLDHDSKLIIEGTYESKSYVDMTIEMLKQFGIQIIQNERILYIPGSQRYLPSHVTVESDYSQMAFFGALGMLNGPVVCGGMNPDSLQGDRSFVRIIEQMNGKIKYNNQQFTFDVSQLQSTEIDLSDCPDLGPVLMMLASFAEGKTKIINAGRLRIKESDRIEAMEKELRKCGVSIHSTEDTIWISGKTPWNPCEELSGHQDHRIVMALAIGSVIAQCPIIIDQAEAVGKSYPGFFNDLASLGVQVELLKTESEE